MMIYRAGQGEIVEKKSRFIASIFPAADEQEALEQIAVVKKKHYDARHNCFAYVIGEQNEIERCSDDGEPSGTAGRPILDILKGKEIHNAVVIVTRYFGGTLLGTGGLIRAYSGAVKQGLANCVLLEKKNGHKMSIKTDYNSVGKIQYIARTQKLFEMNTVYEQDVQLFYLVPDERRQEIEHEIIEKTGGKADIEWLEKVDYGISENETIIL